MIVGRRYILERILLFISMIPFIRISSNTSLAKSIKSEDSKGKNMIEVNRAFVRIDEGLIHYRYSGNIDEKNNLPLYMMHAGPGSSKSLANILSLLGEDRYCIAADTLGFGESDPPLAEKPDLEYYADSVARILDRLKIHKVDMFGSHTGANIGLEFAIKHPDRVRRLIFDGVALFEPQLAADMLKNYAPEITPQPNGEHFIWAWNFIKDMGVYFPHYKRDKEHYLGKEPWPTEMLHNSVVEVMKAMKHYHKGYNAVFMHKTLERLPLLQTPTLCMGHEADPLHVSVEKASSLIKNSKHLVLEFKSGAKEKYKVISDFLES